MRCLLQSVIAFTACSVNWYDTAVVYYEGKSDSNCPNRCRLAQSVTSYRNNVDAVLFLVTVVSLSVMVLGVAHLFLIVYASSHRGRCGRCALVSAGRRRRRAIWLDDMNNHVVTLESSAASRMSATTHAGSSSDGQNSNVVPHNGISILAACGTSRLQGFHSCGLSLSYLEASSGAVGVHSSSRAKYNKSILSAAWPEAINDCCCPGWGSHATQGFWCRKCRHRREVRERQHPIKRGMVKQARGLDILLLRNASVELSGDDVKHLRVSSAERGIGFRCESNLDACVCK